MVMIHDAVSWLWFTMMIHDDDSWWCFMMMFHDDYSGLWIMHDDDSWWWFMMMMMTMMMMHDDNSSWFIMIHHESSSFMMFHGISWWYLPIIPIPSSTRWAPWISWPVAVAWGQKCTAAATWEWSWTSYRATYCRRPRIRDPRNPGRNPGIPAVGDDPPGKPWKMPGVYGLWMLWNAWCLFVVKIWLNLELCICTIWHVCSLWEWKCSPKTAGFQRS